MTTGERMKLLWQNPEYRKRILESRKGTQSGERHPFWKGENVGYRALHRWVEKWLGKPQKCENCGREKTTPRSIHWANKSGEYKRELSDWISLCVPCHREYDAESYKTENNNRRFYYNRWLKAVVPLPK